MIRDAVHGGEADLVLDRLLPLGLAALVVVGTYRGQLPLTGLSATLLIALTIARYWSRHSLDSVTYERDLSDYRAFPGDELGLTLSLANCKLLPVPWIELSDAVPVSLLLKGEAGSIAPEGGCIRQVAALSWHERISWRYCVECRRRGIYTFGPAEAISGDPLGLFSVRALVGGTTRLVVYPRIVPVDHIKLYSDFPIGERSPQRWIFEDPSRVVGVRDYLRGDSLRRIHWKATARRQELQAKVYEPTTMLEIALFLAVDTFVSRENGGESEPFEGAVSTVASLARELTERRHPVGLYANGGQSGGGTLELAPASGEDQLVRILEALAGITSVASTSAEMQLMDVVPRLPWGTSTVIVAGQVSEGISLAIETLRRAGRRVEVVAMHQDAGAGIHD